MMNSLLYNLLSQHSVTPDKSDCLNILDELLTANGFACEHIPFGDVDNLWAVHNADRTDLPLLVLGGHTDVVPPGKVGGADGWVSDPFMPTERDGHVFARGAADMKTGVATMGLITIHYKERYPDYPGRIGVMVTADEEGPALDGIRKLMPHLAGQGVKIDYALFTEPTSVETLGDMIKHGRRGSLHADLTVIGVQGHVAYPHKAANPIHALATIVSELTQQSWCDGNSAFPATTLQVSAFHAGVGADNVIPPTANVRFNFRYSNELSASTIEKRVTRVVERHLAEQSSATLFLDYQLDWTHSAEPFLTPKGKVVNAMVRAIEDTLAITPALSTSGGTSDARFIAPYGTQVIEFGVINETIHQINECVKIDDIARVEDTYLRFYEHVFEVVS